MAVPNVTQLEDRILVLQDAVDVLMVKVGLPSYIPVVKAGFDPNQPRDEEGQWSGGGAFFSGGDDWTHDPAAPPAKRWAVERVANFVKDYAVSRVKEPKRARDDAINVAAAALQGLAGPGHQDEAGVDAVRTALTHMADNLNITRAAAQRQVLDVLTTVRNKLVAKRDSETMEKATAEERLALLNQEIAEVERAIALVKGLVFEEDLNKLEDRLLELQDHVDVLTKAGFNPAQTRDDSGKWSDGGGSFARAPTKDGEQQKRWKKWVRAGLITAGTLGATAGLGYAAHAGLLHSTARQAGALGISPEAVKLHYSGGLTGIYGLATPNKNEIQLYPLRILTSRENRVTMKSVLAHEAMHLKVTQALGFSPHRLFSSPVWKEINRTATLLSLEPAVTAYAKQYWDRWRSAPTPKNLYYAVHESMAEMAAMETHAGKLHGGPRTRDLYKRLTAAGQGKGFVMVPS